MIEQKQRFYIPCLNGWRAISILMVILYHCAWFLFGPEGSKYDPNLWSLFKVGGYGVSIFFTISGYLITSRILEEYRQFDSFNIRDFYVKRFFRIIPPFYFYIFTIFMMNFFLPLNLSSWDFFGSLSFLRISIFEIVLTVDFFLDFKAVKLRKSLVPTNRSAASFIFPTSRGFLMWR